MSRPIIPIIRQGVFAASYSPSSILFTVVRYAAMKIKKITSAKMPDPIVIGRTHTGGTTSPVQSATYERTSGASKTRNTEIARSGSTVNRKKKIDPMTAYSCAAHTSGGLTDIDLSLELGSVSEPASTYKEHVAVRA